MTRKLNCISTLSAVLFALSIGGAIASAQLPNPKVKTVNPKPADAAVQSAPTVAAPSEQTVAARTAPRREFSSVEVARRMAAKDFIVLKTQTNNPAPDAWKYEAPSAKRRAQKYLNRVAGVGTLIGTTVSAGFAHAADEPEEWEDDFKGYARRFGSAFARNAIEETVTFGLDEAFKVDSAFYKKGKGTSFNKRFSNAVVSAFTARTRSGKRIVGVPRFVGTYTSSVIAYETWYPDRFDYRDGLRDGTYSLGFNVVVNLFREFVLPGKRE